MALVYKHYLSFKGIAVVCAVLMSVSLVVLTLRSGDVWSRDISMKKNMSDIRTIHANPYNVLRDILELSGHYGYHGFNSNQQLGDAELKQAGLTSLLHKVRSTVLQDETIEATFLPADKFFKVGRTVKHLNCKSLFEGNKTEIQNAKILMERDPTAREQIKAEDYINITENCSSFKSSRGYILSPLTKVEEAFPIAFSILMFTDVWQFERLLRAVYRPQNTYCLHVDNTSSSIIFNAVLRISRCFDNVFISSKRFDVQWGKMTVLEPELTCMQDLWNKSKTWKYFINLTGQEFPLQTNYQLVNILKAYNRYNDVAGDITGAHSKRWEKAGPPPHRMIPVKGNVHVTVTRGYVNFLLHDQRAQDLLNWVRKTVIPDETFFATLNHNPSLNVPGSFRGIPQGDQVKRPYLSRFIRWESGGKSCAGKWVREVCVFGIGDLPDLAKRKEMFANKFHSSFEHFALDCMEELLFNQTRDEYLGKVWFDSKWYSQLGFVSNKTDT